MTCPLCNLRRSRRACPALGRQICAVCCGTKRLTEINCPSDCAYLSSAREHPPAVVVRRQQRDVGAIMEVIRDFNDRQSQLFLLIVRFLMHYSPPELQQVIDEDVREAAGALAATFETAARGVIYEHRPASPPAERLAAALRPVLAEAGARGGTSFDRDAAFVLRRLEEAARDIQAIEPGRRALLDLLARVISKGEQASAADEPQSRLIVP